MADSYLTLPASDQKDILQTAAATLGRNASVLEKDIWVCWSLQTLFSMPNAHPMAFKGGTSLSKVYNIIDRFSEDIDITLDYRFFEKDFDPFSANASNSQIKKFSRRLKDHVKHYANDVMIPFLQSTLLKLPTYDQHTIKADDSGEKIWFSYPSVTEASDEYLTSQILIELGGRNVIDPNELHTITPYVASSTSGVHYPSKEVVVLSPERTFWEKATLAHVECHRGQLKDSAERLSRHWYDLFMLAKHASGKKAIQNRILFDDVIRHKKVFFNASYANYNACQQGHLKIVPNEDTLKSLQHDYEKMIRSGMLYESKPSFNDITASLRQIEQDINTW